jgi:hypothetical protein
MRERCYIAGKISGLKRVEWMENFRVAKLEVEALGMEPVSPADVTDNLGKTWEECMRKDITRMLTCTHIYLLNNWGNSRGAKIEFALAVELGMWAHYQPVKHNLPPVQRDNIQ